MIRDVYVPRRVTVPFVLDCVLLLAFVLLVLAGSPIALASSGSQSNSTVRHFQHYLALGDSLAYGFQPNGDHTHGYVDDYFTFLQSRGVQDHLNLGCPGETSSSFISGGKCPYPSPFSSQLATAVGYLQQQAHAGQVTLVTLDIGANDLLGDIDPTTCKVSNTFTADLQTLDTNLTKTILPQLHAALKGNHGQVTGNLMLLNYYDAFQNVCPNTVQKIEMLNTHLAHDVGNFDVLVNIFKAFGGAAVPNPNICTDTWVCSPPPGPDIHPTTAGYQVIANALEKSYNSCGGHIDGNRNGTVSGDDSTADEVCEKVRSH
ncbi:MAG TPA: SGNH/GDSL hydrolase family protein [Ktedonobacteraceae bacterium]|nr:SGNH/GDSL hydrolase family protein [Ktedonobacteraceae bacterium]